MATALIPDKRGPAPTAEFRSGILLGLVAAVANGLIKAEVFGFVVVLVCCNIGLNTRGGPREIGASVTRAVVTSLILILVLDYFVTKALLMS